MYKTLKKEAAIFEMITKLNEQHEGLELMFALVEKFKEKDREIERLQGQLQVREKVIEDLRQQQKHSLDDDMKYRAIVSILNGCITNLSFDTEGRWSLDGFLKR